MKKKDIIYIVLAAAIFLAAGYIVYTKLIPQSSSTGATGTQVEVIGNIDPNFDPSALGELNDPTKVKDFAVKLDLTTGLGNAAPFGQ